jgi:putative flippase GtrA
MRLSDAQREDGASPARFVPAAFRPQLIRQFGRFLLVGGTATLLHYAILIALHGALAVDADVATAIGFFLSATFNFVASYYFTFQSATPLSRALPRYALVVGTGLLINGALFSAVNGLLGMHYLIAQLLATGVVLFWNFWLARGFAFAAVTAARDRSERS